MSSDTPSFGGDSPVPASLPDLSQGQLRRLGHYRDALFEYNKTTNLTAVRDLAGIDRRLILESVRLVHPLETVLSDNQLSRPSVLDIGTGGGLPGLVLAITMPGIDVTLLDATGKKITFLQNVIGDIGITNARTIHDRAETIARDPALRGTFDVVVARAVTSLPALVELGLPMVRLGGHLLLPKGLTIDDELEAGEVAARIVGGEIVDASVLPDAGSEIETRLVIFRKTAPTPEEYPRRSGIPSRSPLGTRLDANPSGTPRPGGARPAR